MTFRIGSGFDVHSFCDGDGLWLGGHFIQAGYSLKGHSDADVLLHALTDAILGALGEADIGSFFPDSSAENKGRPSSEFLAFALEKASEQKMKLGNIDLTLIGEKPRISHYRQELLYSLANLTGLPANAIGLKATTTEKLGFTGRGEGLAAQASVLLVADSPMQ